MPSRVPAWNSALLALLWTLYLVLWAGGIASHVFIGRTPTNMVWTAPFFLAFASAIALVSAPMWWKPMAAAAAIGFVAELISVHTGIPFGHYRYTDVLGPSIAGVPIVVAGAWLVLFAYVSQMRVHPALAAAWIAAIDLVIDPPSSNYLGCWEWVQRGPYFGAPWINSAGWFVVGFVIFFGLSRFPPPRSSSIAMLGRTFLFFFSAIAAAHHYLFPAFLGLALSALGYWRFRSVKVSTIV